MEDNESVLLPEFITKYIKEKYLHRETEGSVICKEVHENYEGEEYIVIKEWKTDSVNFGKWILIPSETKDGYVLNDGNWEKFTYTE